MVHAHCRRAVAQAAFAALLPVLSASGCVTYLLAGDVKADIDEARRAHHYGFIQQQTTKMREAGACAAAARYLAERSDPNSARRGGFLSPGPTGLSPEDIAGRADAFRADATALKDACEHGEVAALTAGRRYERLEQTLTALASLPLDDTTKSALALRAQKVALVRAEAQIADGDAHWAAGRLDDALEAYQRARGLADGCAAATPEEKQRVSAVLARRTDEAAARHAARATDAEAKGEWHYAALSWAKVRALQPSPQVQARLATAKRNLLAGHVYRFFVQLQGEPRITKAADAVLSAHRFEGNTSRSAAAAGADFSAVVDVDAFNVTQNERSGTRSGSYKTGTRSVDNPEYRTIQAFITRQQQCLASMGSVSFGTNQSFADQKKHGCDYYCSSYECSTKENRARLNRAQAELGRTPMIKQEDVFSSKEYPTREWTQVLRAPVRLALKHALDTAAKPAPFTLEHTYSDHAHDAVALLDLDAKAIAKRSEDALAADAGQKLGAQIVAEIEADYRAWLAATPKLGDRGAVLAILLNGDTAGLDARLAEQTGIKNATALLKAP